MEEVETYLEAAVRLSRLYAGILEHTILTILYSRHCAKEGIGWRRRRVFQRGVTKFSSPSLIRESKGGPRVKGSFPRGKSWSTWYDLGPIVKVATIGFELTMHAAVAWVRGTLQIAQAVSNLPLTSS